MLPEVFVFYQNNFLILKLLISYFYCIYIIFYIFMTGIS